ncbi:Rod shape-determining protein OS=Streptomyces tendae OX=1932 GN=GUR47_31135 PE=4 SV=1 [Streptomyces tendae]
MEVLRPRTVLTVPGARAVALAAGADHVRPLLVVDIGAQLTEVVLLVDGAVIDARRTALGTADLSRRHPASARITDVVVGMVTAMLRQDGTSLHGRPRCAAACCWRAAALRPAITAGLPAGWTDHCRAVPAPHTAAVRGAAALLTAAHRHPSVTGPDSAPDDHPH